MGVREDVGGIVGQNLSKIKLCYNCGKVINNNVSDGYDVGGIVGQNGREAEESSKTIIIENCYNTGSVGGNRARSGGIAGWNVGSTVNNCYNIGTVKANSKYGSIVGSNNELYIGFVTKAYFLLGTANNGIGIGMGDAISKTRDEIKPLATTLGSEFINDVKNEDGTWKYNNGYPILKWQTENE